MKPARLINKPQGLKWIVTHKAFRKYFKKYGYGDLDIQKQVGRNVDRQKISAEISKNFEETY